MSFVTMLWSGVAAAALLLGIVHARVWTQDRTAHANLALAVVAVSLAGIAVTELRMMTAMSPQEWLQWARWCHIPLFMHISAVVIFVRCYLGTGRLWLLLTIVAMRLVILLVNFSSPTGFNFSRVDATERISFLGDSITVFSSGQVSSTQWFSTVSLLLMIVFVLDAARALWRRGEPEARRRAVVVGGGLMFFLGLATLMTQLVIWGVARTAILITPPFLISLTVMALELGRDTVRANRLAGDLRESEHWLELAANASLLGFWSWDAKRHGISATDRARQLLGFDSQERICPESLGSRIHSDDLACVRSTLLESPGHPGAYNVQFRCVDEHSQCRWIAAHARVERDANGTPVRIRGVLHDISLLKQAEHEAEELRRTLTHAGRVTMLGQLAAALAHELSQPLGAILRNAEAGALLLDAHPPDIEELRAILTDIRSDDHRAGEVIDRLRSLLKRREMQLQPLSLDSLVKDAGALVRAEAAARHVALTYHTQVQLPLVRADHVHLLQVLINLLVNAVDATCDPCTTRRCVTVSTRTTANRCVEITVADSGPGISGEALPRIFEPFFTTKACGMGMGLTVSRTIVEAHGGSLRAENDPAGGAIFRVTLPIIQELPT